MFMQMCLLHDGNFIMNDPGGLWTTEDNSGLRAAAQLPHHCTFNNAEPEHKRDSLYKYYISVFLFFFCYQTYRQQQTVNKLLPSNQRILFMYF